MPVPTAPVDGDGLRATESRYRELLRRLTVKEQVLVHEYLIDGNGTRSAKVAGYAVRAATEIAHETLRKPQVAATLQAGLDMLAIRCQISAERVLHELAGIAFASSSHFVEAADGSLVAEEGAEASGAASQVRHRHIKKA